MVKCLVTYTSLINCYELFRSSRDSLLNLNYQRSKLFSTSVFHKIYETSKILRLSFKITQLNIINVLKKNKKIYILI